MSEQRYDLLQFAEWLKNDTTPNGGADLWAASALYDFQIDPNNGQLSTQPFNEETVKKGSLKRIFGSDLLKKVNFLK